MKEQKDKEGRECVQRIYLRHRAALRQQAAPVLLMAQHQAARPSCMQGIHPAPTYTYSENTI